MLQIGVTDYSIRFDHIIMSLFSVVWECVFSGQYVNQHHAVAANPFIILSKHNKKSHSTVNLPAIEFGFTPVDLNRFLMGFAHTSCSGSFNKCT